MCGKMNAREMVPAELPSHLQQPMTEGVDDPAESHGGRQIAVLVRQTQEAHYAL